MRRESEYVGHARQSAAEFRRPRVRSAELLPVALLAVRNAGTAPSDSHYQFRKHGSPKCVRWFDMDPWNADAGQDEHGNRLHICVWNVSNRPLRERGMERIALDGLRGERR